MTAECRLSAYFVVAYRTLHGDVSFDLIVGVPLDGALYQGPETIQHTRTPVEVNRVFVRIFSRAVETRRSKMETMKYLIAFLAVAGIVVSSLALHVHYMDPAATPPCAVTEKFDCGAVNRSKYAVFPPITDDEFDENGQLHPNQPHIPVAFIGIVGYGLIGIFALIGRIRIVLEMAEIGFFCAAFLSYLEAYVIHKWCIYCLWSQCIIAAILLLSIVAVLMGRSRRAASMVAVLSEHVD